MAVFTAREGDVAAERERVGGEREMKEINPWVNQARRAAIDKEIRQGSDYLMTHQRMRRGKLSALQSPHFQFVS